MERILNAAIIAPACPYLGMRDDPSAYFSYASSGNRCYHCKQPVTPLMAHQEDFCLKGAQADCPAYLLTERLAFPVALRQAAGTPHRDRNLPSARVALALAIGLVAVGFVVWRFFPGILSLPMREPAPVLEPSAAAILPTVTALRPATSRPLPTSTIAPTAVPSPQAHALDIPLEINGIKLLMHRVGGGETFEMIDAKYDTTSDVVRALNSSVRASLWADTVIVIAPGLQAVDSSLPSFKVHEVDELSTTIDHVALEYGVEAALLRQYNGCTDACPLSTGDWILIPVTSK